jgi:hypothetical protein
MKLEQRRLRGHLGGCGISEAAIDNLVHHASGRSEWGGKSFWETALAVVCEYVASGGLPGGVTRPVSMHLPRAAAVHDYLASSGVQDAAKMTARASAVSSQHDDMCMFEASIMVLCDHIDSKRGRGAEYVKVKHDDLRLILEFVPCRTLLDDRVSDAYYRIADCIELDVEPLI